MSQATLTAKKSGVLVAQDTATIAETLASMEAAGVGSIVIVKSHVIAGIVTERDVLKHWRKLADPAFLAKPVTAIMTSPVKTILVAKTQTAAHVMLDGRIRHLPVVAEDSTLVGMLSIRDVLASLVARQDEQAKAQSARASAAAAASAAHARHRVMNIVMPTHGLDYTCKSLVPPHWICTVWNDIRDLAAASFQAEIAKKGAAFFIDLDGLDQEAWKALLREFIGHLKEKNNPEVFLTWTPGIVGPAAIKSLQHITAVAKWHAYERPLPIAALAEDLRALT